MNPRLFFQRRVYPVVSSLHVLILSFINLNKVQKVLHLVLFHFLKYTYVHFT